MDDDVLMQRIATGDEDALRVLVQRWQRPVYGFLVHMVRSPQEAEDLTQDVFLKVHEQAGRYRAQGKFRSWLMRIAGNAARSVLRRRKIIRWISFDPSKHDRPARGDDPIQRLERDETIAMVQAAIDRLPARQREAVVMRRYQDMSYQEIADALGTTIPGVESLLQRATAALRRELEPDTAAAGGRKQR